MNEDELRALVTGALDADKEDAPWSERSGAVLYSDLASVRPGRVYLMGINPGGRNDQEPSAAIVHHLAAPPGTNNYADERWDSETGGCTPMQRRVCSLFEMLGADPKDVLSTNLIFARSSQLSTLCGSKAEWKRRCGVVHSELLKIVRPRWIITLGFGEAYSSARTFITGEVEPQERIMLNGRAVAWFQRRKATLEDASGPVGILGVAHPSHRGFGRAGLNSDTYPDAIGQFIAKQVLPIEATKGGL